MVFLALLLWTGFSSGTLTGVERGMRKRWREKMEKSERGALAFGRSVINKGPETHSDPVIDLTTGVKINTHTH